jgi:hypothetical protein
MLSRRVDIAYFQVLAIIEFSVKLSRNPISPYDLPYKFENRISEFCMGNLIFHNSAEVELLPPSALEDSAGGQEDTIAIAYAHGSRTIFLEDCMAAPQHRARVLYIYFSGTGRLY